MVDYDRVGVVVPNHVDEWDSPYIDVRIVPPTQYGTFGGGDLRVVGVVDVDGVLVKDSDVISNGILARAKKGMLTGAWGGMEFVDGGSNGKRIIRDFGGWYDCYAWEDELLGRLGPSASAWIGCSAYSRGGAAVNDRGSDGAP